MELLVRGMLCYAVVQCSAVQYSGAVDSACSGVLLCSAVQCSAVERFMQWCGAVYGAVYAREWCCAAVRGTLCYMQLCSAVQWCPGQ